MNIEESLILHPYQRRNLEGLLRVWRSALPLDAITRETFLERVLLDPNCDGDSLIVATLNDQVVGFALCICLHQPIERIGIMPNRGFITAMGVAPEFQGKGIGTRLLSCAETFFKTRGRTEITIAPYAPNYFVPGVDKHAYAHGLAWFKRRGFVEYSEAIAMDAMIGRFDLDDELKRREEELAARGVSIHPLDIADSSHFLSWMELVMPGDWITDARNLLRRVATGDAPPNSVFVATHNNSYVGYCKFDGEHFGPFGVQDTHQGGGLGTLLLARTLLQMRMEGHHSAYVLWTGERAANGVYKRLGFTVSRRFVILKKPLQ